MYVICLSWEIGGGAVESVAASSTGYTGYCLANSVAVALWGEGLGYMGLDMSDYMREGTSEPLIHSKEELIQILELL